LKKLELERADYVLREGYAPPRRLDGNDEMTLATLGIHDWGVLTLYRRPREVIDVGLVVSMNDAKMSKLAENVWLSAVDACGCIGIGDLGLKAIAGCEQMTWLDVSYTSITGKGVSALSVLPRLETFTAIKCGLLGDDAGEALAKIESLTAINLSYCPQLTSKCIKGFGDLPSLKSVHLMRCDSMFQPFRRVNGDLGDHAMDALRRCPTLETINISQSRRVNDRSIINLVCGEGDNALEEYDGVGQPSSLTRLDISYCSETSGESLKAIMLLPNLTSLDCAWNPHVTDDAVGMLANTIKTLVHLNVGGCSKLTKHKREAIAKAKGDKFTLCAVDLPKFQ